MVFNTERESIAWFMGFLEGKGFINIKETQSEDKFCYYDIEAELPTKKGITRWRFELKRRNFDSEKYGDTIIEKSKYDKFVEDIRNGIMEQGRIVSFFTDVMVIDNVLNAYDVDFKMSGKTTDFNDKRLVQKTFVHYINGKKI